eukprot:gene65653-89812_t
MAEAELPEDVDMAAMFDLNLKKKKKKKPKKDSAAEDGDDQAGGANDLEGKKVDSSSVPETIVASSIYDLDPPTYSYAQLLNRVVDFVHQNNPELTDKKRFTMKPPQLMRVGTKKTLWVNYQEICLMMRRNPDHVFQFMMAELGTEGSIDGSKRL